MDDRAIIGMIGDGHTYADVAKAFQTTARDIQRRMNRLGLDAQRIQRQKEIAHVVHEVEFLLGYGEKPSRIAAGIEHHRPGFPPQPFTTETLYGFLRRNGREDLVDRMRQRSRVGL